MNVGLSNAAAEEDEIVTGGAKHNHFPSEEMQSPDDWSRIEWEE